MRTSFLSKCAPKIWRISALPSKLPGQKSKCKFLVGILEEPMTSHSIHSEINWPLEAIRFVNTQLYWAYIGTIFCFLQGLGKKCPYYLDPSTNDMTGRVIDDQPTIDYILKLHNEVRSKIGRGRCDQPKAGCMWPLVNKTIYFKVKTFWESQKSLCHPPFIFF